MLHLNVLTVAATALLSIVTAQDPHLRYPGDCPCLTDAEAFDISSRWLSIFSTGGVTSKGQLATIVAQSLASYDDTEGDPTFGIDQLWAALTAPGNATTTNVKQFPLDVFHTCDRIALRWQYKAVTTGYGSTVPAGTPVSFKGNDILRVDIDTKLIYNASSSGDWILLARQLGATCNF